MRPISKAILYFGISLVVGGGILFWLGSLKKKHQVDVTIQAPHEVVFRHLTEPRLIKKWQQGVTKIEPLQGRNRKQGSTARVTIERDGKTYQLEDEVITYDINSRLVVVSESTMARDVVDFSIDELAPGKEQTNLRLIVHRQYKGIFRFAAPFLGGDITQQLEADMEQLKLLAEQAYAPNSNQPAPDQGDKPVANGNGTVEPEIPSKSGTDSGSPQSSNDK